MINTGKVTDRRKLRFQSISQLLSDVDRIVAADKAGTLRCSGNWTAGQILGHLASWINYGYEGYPFTTPWFIRLILRFKVKKYLREGMTAGVRIPGVEAGTYGVEKLSTQEGAERLRQAIARLQKGEPVGFDSPGFGKMSAEERLTLNLRHAELHLSFLHPG